LSPSAPWLFLSSVESVGERKPRSRSCQTTTKTLHLDRYNPEFFAILDGLKNPQTDNDHKVIVAEMGVSVKTTTLRDVAAILTKSMRGHIRQLNILASGGTIDVNNGWTVKITGQMILDIRVPRSTLDRDHDLRTKREEFLRTEGTLSPKVEVIIGVMEDAIS
jgi:hypothetical protein